MSIFKAYAYVDTFMAKAAAKSAAQGKPVTCRGAGCCGCCKEPVYAEREEVREIVRAMTPAQRARAQDRTAQWWALFMAGGFSEADETVEPKEDRKKDFVFLTKYRAAMLWCPLLGVHGECTAYATRPLSCRYHNATGNPRNCEDDERRPRQVYMTMQEMPKVNAAALGMMAQNAPQMLFEFDHLGVLLGHELLGETLSSKAKKILIVKQTDPRDEPR